ncbi:hypothetical protein HDF26_004573 [Pedobacter cryoconitis]|uniref:hypothetical protein n=1 Tax=Pedobacter cryoconitis TaxID=188932 RepID=UPI00160E2AA3|nr:hypothetical protein [Pedobacter cryoconitis]MBB6274100.1 hypothetical protein [Pedobacter cryoconitis]
MMNLEAIEEFKRLFRAETGLDAEENAADFAGWLFLKRQTAIIEIIKDLNDRNQNQPATVKLLKSVMNRLLLV